MDSRGRGLVIGGDCRIQCGGAAVYPSDVVMADYDGAAIISEAIVRSSGAALEKAERPKMSSLEGHT